MQSFINEQTLSLALQQLAGTAGTQFRIWMVLKHEGLTQESPVTVTTSSTEAALVRLFGCGHPDGKLFTPYVSIPSDKFMAPHAARSIVQTTVVQWSDGTGVYSPGEYLAVEALPQQGNTKPYRVSTKRTYPEGLGIGKDGFAHTEGGRVSVPKQAFAIWYGRQTPIPDGEVPVDYLLKKLREALNLSSIEEGCVFIDKEILVSTKSNALTDDEIFSLVSGIGNSEYTSVELPASRTEHIDNIRSQQTMSTRPKFLNAAPELTLKSLLDAGAKVILLSGPPRTGKTRAIDLLVPRNDPGRESIQIHDGWTYEHLIQGLRPQADNSFSYVFGPLAEAIKTGKKHIVLEEINRTLISQSLGEVFSLLEEAYRGEANGYKLRDGSIFFIPEDVTFYFTMNTIDNSTEDVDDALIARCYSVEFPPRVEELSAMLLSKQVPSDVVNKLCRLFSTIQETYPLGHGYFADFKQNTSALLFYQTKIRPVLFNHLQHQRAEVLSGIDNLVETLFSAA